VQFVIARKVIKRFVFFVILWYKYTDFVACIDNTIFGIGQQVVDVFSAREHFGPVVNARFGMWEAWGATPLQSLALLTYTFFTVVESRRLSGFSLCRRRVGHYDGRTISPSRL